MKLSSLILLVIFVLLVTAMFASNVLLKKEYDKVDKSDIYWTYGKILQQPFKHLKIEGGNLTNIAFEPSKTPSVRVLKNWWGYDNEVVKAAVRNDTLFVKFPRFYKNPFEKQYMAWNTLVRIFSPELLSVDGFDTNVELFKLKQKAISINLSGRSKLEVESYLHDLDSLTITQRDSSSVVFEMSPEVIPAKTSVSQIPGTKDHLSMHAEPSDITIQQSSPSHDVTSNSWETLYVQKVHATIQGMSLLDLGHAQIGSLDLHISDTSAIIISGGSLRKFKKQP